MSTASRLSRGADDVYSEVKWKVRIRVQTLKAVGQKHLVDSPTLSCAIGLLVALCRRTGRPHLGVEELCTSGYLLAARKEEREGRQMAQALRCKLLHILRAKYIPCASKHKIDSFLWIGCCQIAIYSESAAKTDNRKKGSFQDRAALQCSSLAVRSISSCSLTAEKAMSLLQLSL